VEGAVLSWMVISDAESGEKYFRGKWYVPGWHKEGKWGSRSLALK